MNALIYHYGRAPSQSQSKMFESSEPGHHLPFSPIDPDEGKLPSAVKTQLEGWNFSNIYIPVSGG